MYKRFKDLESIKFPVYALPTIDYINRQDGVLFINGKVVDDANMPGATLGVRRIQCGRSDLLRLKKAYPTFLDMLQAPKNKFVDSNGIVFTYKKSTHSDLKYHLVKEIITKEDKSIVYLRGIHCPMTIPRPPYGDARYARVLYYQGEPWLIYDFARERGKDSYRRV
jgi:hypothetical protein